MTIQLTEDQAKKFETIKWLTDPLGSRGSGRTQLLAMAYINHSLNYKTWVSIINHGNNHPMADKELIDRIVGIVHKMGEYTVKIKRQSSSILVEPIIKEYDEPYFDLLGED